MAHPKHPDTCRYCPKPMARRNNGYKRVCTGCNQKRKLWYGYGMTVEQYKRLYKKQSGLCAICLQPETALTKEGEVRQLCVDHDHNTMAIRGLLCYHCNQGIGQFKDNALTLESAAKYLSQDYTQHQKVNPKLGTSWATKN